MTDLSENHSQLQHSQQARIKSRPARALLIATQVAKQSLDTDFEFILRDLAPTYPFLRNLYLLPLTNARYSEEGLGLRLNPQMGLSIEVRPSDLNQK